MKSVEEQLEVIRRGCEQIVPLDELRKKLQRSVEAKVPLRVKYGIDPTGFDVHLGHTVPLRKLRQFQELGHRAVLIIGDYTAMVGDPSGRDDSRKGLTRDQIEKNCQTYLAQISRIIDIDAAEVRHNGEWFSRFNFGDVLALTGQITLQRMLERDDFTKRHKAGTPIYLSECLYPLMQGRDSVEIHADVELGGSEQLYNLMVGRNLQSDAGQEPQVCITMPILRGTDGERKMGKSVGNYVGVNEPVRDQFGKTMRIPDTLLREWFELLTDRTADEIDELLDPAKNPADAKKTLAADVVRFYHGDDTARSARAEWDRMTQGGDPDEIAEVDLLRDELEDGKLTIVKLLVLTGLVKSNGEARRVLGPATGVTVGPDRQKVTDPAAVLEVTDGMIVRKGRHVVRVSLK